MKLVFSSQWQNFLLVYCILQKWKAFAARVEAMTVSLKKKDVKGAQVAHGAALTALDEYLELVELASAK